MAQGSINVNVGGIQYEEPSATYKRVVLKSNLSFKSQVEGSSNANSLFIIKWDFDLGGETVDIPSNCILQFEGGVLRNGTVNLNNTRIWPCYDALTIGDVTITGTPLGGDGELIYKEYSLKHYDGDFVYDGNVVKSDYDYYEVSANEIMSAINSGYKVIKYGFTACKAYFVKKDSETVFFKNLNLPYTITSEEISIIAGKTGPSPYYLHIINNGRLIPKNLRISY